MRISILPILALSLLFAACGKDMQFYEQAYTPLHLEMGFDDFADAMQSDEFSTGKIRYIIRTFPVGAIYGKTKPVQEFTVLRDLKDGPGHTATLDFLTGSYDVMVWADLIEDGKSASCYDADDFGHIGLDAAAAGSSMYRNAFRGVATVDVEEGDEPAVLKVAMESPLARFELVSDDLKEFGMSLDGYRVVVYYVGYVPSVYSLYADKPVDSASDVWFESAFTQVSDDEAMLGGDYVFVGERASSVTVKVGVYDEDEKLVSLSAAVRVPLQRGGNTVKKGSFLTSKSSLDGIYIDKDFDGSFDIEI